MRFSPALVLAVAGTAAAVAAPAASGVPSGCGKAIDAIIQSCLGSTSIQLNACASTNYRCQCDAVINVVTCFNNCPNDPNAFGWQQKKISWCNAAKTQPKPTSSSVAPNAGKHIPTPVSASGSSGPGTHTGFAKGSASASAHPNSAAVMNPASGLLAAAFGFFLL